LFKQIIPTNAQVFECTLSHTFHYPNMFPSSSDHPHTSYIKQTSYQNIHLPFPPDMNTYDSIILWYAHHMDKVCTYIYYEQYVIHNF